MGRAKNGEAVSGERRSRAEKRRLTRLLSEAQKRKDLDTWRRAKAVLDYLGGKSVITLCSELHVVRSTINRWLIWFQAEGTDGLRTKKAPGGTPLLTDNQYGELISLIEAGPIVAGFSTGLWTGPMIGELIRHRFGVKYHNHHIPRLLHKLGFSVQRPRRRLARADRERQGVWLKETFPAIKKKAAACRGVVLFADEASFWLDGTLHQTWARIGEQPRVDTYGERKTAHIFGAVHLNDANFTYQFADVFNGDTFFKFLRLLVRRYKGRKVFLIIDNGPCHNLKKDGVRWLRANGARISLHRLPPYSPEFNPVEPIWKMTRKLATHNRFYRTTIERNAALRRAFQRFYSNPSLISAHVARFK